MRATLPLIALIAATGAAADTPRATVSGPANTAPTEGRAVCRDRIEQVRAASGLPRLDRDNAAADDQPLLIAAVDKRIDGCSVMVMYNNTSDIRPLPRVDGTGRLRRIR